jgi:hypothetical protein
MSRFGVCYITQDGLGVTASSTVEADDLDEALVLARLDPDRPCPSTYGTVEIWLGGRRLFCGDPNKQAHREAPDERCDVAMPVGA